MIAFIRVASHQWALLTEGVIGLACRHRDTRVACHHYPRFALPHRISGRSLQASLRLSRTYLFEMAITNEWLLLVMGALSLLFGILILFRPGVGALAIV